ncbi:GNAT family N-acetyltransferase [Candidatus Kaiserbacteria bacterium]|nr:GNAT family N-acetyltransferase [Candidatus Kaiserbacteria bacterium]
MVTISKLTAITDASVRELNELMRQLREGSTAAASKEDMQELLNDENIVVIVAKDDERIVGVATLYVMPKIGKRIGYVEDVVVGEEYRGQGIGEKIMHELINIAMGRNIRTLSLTSRPERIAGNKLYQKLGFERKETNSYRLKL